MRALALVLLGVATGVPASRAIRTLLAVAAAAALVRSVWEPTFRGAFTDSGWTNAWVVPAVVLLAVAATELVPSLPAEGGAWLGWRWVLLAGAAVAVYACVPETDQMPPVIAVPVGAAVIEQLRRRPLPEQVFAAGWGLVAWSALYGASGRPSALLGGLFALLPPLAAAVVGRRGVRCAAAVGVVWVVAAVVVARTGGVADRPGPAVTAVVIGALVAGSLSAVLWRRWSTPPLDG
ncbi:MAG: hypothetical protein Q8M22_08000 [Actinomycetota bacterium]|nr:hypothetical protein [Actinomycetota bacterium]